MGNTNLNWGLASSITKDASKQTYYTIRFLADRKLAADAYRAYAYFRWVDDTLDAGSGSRLERNAFIDRQKLLLDNCYRGIAVWDATAEEQLLVDLVRNDPAKNSGLQFYLHNMMAVMAFDVERRGRLISQNELSEYTRWLASAVTEAMHYFIGHGCYAPQNEARHLAVTAAHIVHMLRDTYDDIQAGYFNIPREVLEANHLTPYDVQNVAYQAWVSSRVKLARTYFKRGREYLNQVENLRCRLAGFAYTARFEWLLNTIEKEGYCLRSQYDERKSIGTGLRMSWLTFSSMINSRGFVVKPQTIPVNQRSLR